MIETQPRVETSRLSPFERMQAFLKEHGGIDSQTQQLRLERGGYSLTRLSLLPLGFDTTEIRRYFDLSITQTLPTGDIEIALDETTKERKPKDTRTQITLTNPLNNMQGKAIIRPFSHIGNVLGLSKSKWVEAVDEIGRFYATDSDEEVEKIVSDFTRWKPESLQSIEGGTRRKMVGRYSEEPKLSRRGFLRLAALSGGALALDTLLSHIPYSPSLSKKFWEQLETATIGIPPEEFRKEIETGFNIEIVGPSTGMVEVVHSDKRYPTAEWDKPRLKVLINTLAELPPHFYLPRMIEGQEHKVRFVLMNPPLTAVMAAVTGREKLYGGWCACHAAENQLVVVNMKSADPTLPWAGETQRIFIHEITHSLTTPEIDQYIRRIAEPIGIKSTTDLMQAFSSELIVNRSEKVDVYGTFLTKKYFNFTTDENGIIRGQFLKGGEREPKEELVLIGDRIVVSREDLYLSGETQIKDALVRDARKYAPEIMTFEDYERGYLPSSRGRSLDEDEDALFLVKVKKDNSSQGHIDYKSHIGYGATNFFEFFSTAAEFYSKGRDEFVKTYKPFLGLERAEMLYDGVKREIFRGREY